MVKKKVNSELEVLVTAALTRGLVQFHDTFRLTKLPDTPGPSTQKDKGQNHSRLAGQPQCPSWQESL